MIPEYPNLDVPLSKGTLASNGSDCDKDEDDNARGLRGA